MIDKENQIGSFKRSASWQITHLLKQMTPEKREALQAEIELHEAKNRLMKLPINEMLLDLTKRGLVKVAK